MTELTNRLSPFVLASMVALCGLTAARASPAAGARPGPGVRLPARPLRTGYDQGRSATEDIVQPLTIVLGDSEALAAEWARRRLAGPAPWVAFPREFAVVIGFPRGSCARPRSGVDSAQRGGGDTVRLYVWEDSDGGCLDTLSYGVMAVAISRTVARVSAPVVSVQWHDRRLARLEREMDAMERRRAPRRRARVSRAVT